MSGKIYFLFFFSFLSSFCENVQAQVGYISTIAGIGTGSSSTTSDYVRGFTGDGGPATSAEINFPYSGPEGLALDGAGNIYISDAANYRIRKINSSGIIATIAGSGSTTGFSGDNGPATAASLNITAGVAVDGSGNVYIADYGFYCIRKVNTSGIITTIAGTPGSGGFSGDGGPATTAQMYAPVGIVLDASGNLYFADRINHRIREVNTSGIITTIAGGSSNGFSGDGSPASSALLSNPWDVKVDGSGNIYIADYGNNRIRKINASGIISTVAGGSGSVTGVGDGGAATANTLSSPCAVAVDGAGNIYISDYGHYSVRKVNTSGIISTLVGNGSSGSFTGDGGPATSATIDNLGGGLCVDGAENIYICTSGNNNRVRKIDGQNHPVKFASGHSLGFSVCANSIADSVNSQLAIIDSDNGQIETWSLLSGPYNGSAVIAVTAISDGDTLYAHGMYYTPASGFIGNDSFKVRVTDGYLSDTTILHVTVIPSPGAITGVAQLCAGLTTTLSDTSTGCTWSSVGTSVATIGSSGIISGSTAGVETISYTYSSTGCAATVVVTVNPLPSVIIGTTNICVGLTITFNDSASGGVWAVSNTNASLGSATGILTGITAGTSIISYSLPTGCIMTTPVTVNASPSAPIAIGTGTAQVCVGQTTTLSDSTAGGAWTSSNVGIATIGSASSLSGSSLLATGVVTGVSGGLATMTYTLPNGCVAVKTVTVNALPSAIASASGSFGLCAGATLPLGDPTSGGAWASSAPLTVTVGSMTGSLSGVSAGMATISYTLPTGCATSVVVTVNPSPPAITGATNACIGLTDTLSDFISGGTWTSSAYDTAFIDGVSGVVTGISAGLATITYTTGSVCFTTTTVNVNPAPSGITGAANVCAGATTTLYNTISGGVWSSSALGVASVGSTSGFVTGIAHGAATISYSTGTGCTVVFPMTVNPSPGPITGATGVCKTSTITLTDTSAGGVWASSAPLTVTIGSATGMATGVGSGLAIISYTIPGTACAATKAVTVNPLPATITGTLHVCPGATTTLTDAGGAWSISAGSPAIATISSSGLVSGIASGTATVKYTLPTSCATSAVVTVNPLPSIPIAIGTGASTVCIGLTINLTDSTTGGAWTKSNANINIGSASGIVTGITAGTTNIFYTLPFTGCFATKTVTVNTAPGAITGPMHVCPGDSITLGNSIAGGTWTSSAGSLSASLTVTVGSSSGKVTGLAAGIAPITYSLGAGCSITTTITVNPLPSVITGVMHECAGASTTLSDSTAGGVWTTASTTASVGSGTGIVTGVSGGPALITYTSPIGCTRTAIVTINPLPSPITGPTAVCVGPTITLSSPGSPGGAWSTGSAGIASIGPATGIVTGLATGTTTITYTLPTGCAANTTVTVSFSPRPITGPSTVCAAGTMTLTDTVGGGVWSSSASSLSIGSLSGIVTGITAGVTTITYSLGTGCTVTKTVTVIAAPALPIAIGTGAGSMCAGGTLSLTETTGGGTWTSSSGTVTIGTTGPLSALVNGVSAGTAGISYTVTSTGCTATTMVTVNPLPAAITGPSVVCIGASIAETDSMAGGVWATTSPAITINSTGDVTGISSGIGNITYALLGCTATRTVTVSSVPAITGPTGMCTGTSITLADVAAGGIWASSASLTVTVGTATGIVTGTGTGTAVIVYNLGAGCSTSLTVTVNAGPSLIGGALNVCAGATTDLSNSAGGGTWSSSAPLTMTVGSSTGVVSGIAPGVATVIYSLGSGCTTTAIVTVNAAPLGITGTTSICLGSTTTLSDLTGGGVWSAGAAGIVSIGATGIVTGLDTGTAPISYTAGGCQAVTTVTVNSLPGAISGSPNLCLGATDTLTDISGGGVWSSSNVLVAPAGSITGIVLGVAPGTATISYSRGVGCAVSMIVTVHPVPAAISGATDVCKGLATTLSDPAFGGTGVWNSSNTAIATVSSAGVVTGVSGGVAIISYTSATGALYGCAATTTIIVNTVPAIEGIHNMCAFDTLHISDSIAGGAWTGSVVSVSGGVITSYTPGVAMIIYTLSDGCSATAMLTVDPLPAPIVVSGGTAHICVGHTISLSESTPGGAWTTGNISVASIGTSGAVTSTGPGMAAMSYTLSATGCIQAVVVTVDAFPSAGAISGPGAVCAGSTITITDTVMGGLWSATNTTAAIGSTGPLSEVVSGISAGMDTIKYSVTNVCGTAMASEGVTINPQPDAGTINGTDSVCIGATIILTNSTTGGTWGTANANLTISGIGIVTGVNAGIDTVSYSVTNFCGTAQTGLTVKVNPLPQTGIITGLASVCIGESDTLTGSPAGGIWSSDGANATINNGIVTGVSAGVDTVRYGFTNSCGSSVTGYGVMVIKCDTVTGVAPPLPIAIGISGGRVTVFPNPAKGQLNVINGANSDLYIYDMVGKEVYRGFISSGKEVVNISALVSGVYMVEFADRSTLLRVTMKLVVE